METKSSLNAVPSQGVGDPPYPTLGFRGPPCPALGFRGPPCLALGFRGPPCPALGFRLRKNLISRLTLESAGNVEGGKSAGLATADEVHPRVGTRRSGLRSAAAAAAAATGAASVPNKLQKQK